jgi:site-specific recombinase XerD
MATFDLIEEFLFFEEASGRAPATVRNHKAALRGVSSGVPSPLEEASTRELIEYLRSIRERYSPDRLNIVVSALRRFFSWLEESGLREDNPARRLRFVPAPPGPVQSLSSAEADKLVEWATKKAPRARFGVYRTGVLALLLLDSGMRLGEALSLELGDIDFHENRIVIRKTKTGRFRLAPLSLPMRTQLRRYLAKREKRAHTERLFINEYGDPLSREAAERSFRSLAGLTGIARRIHPHLLRHTWAVLSSSAGMPIPALMTPGGLPLHPLPRAGPQHWPSPAAEQAHARRGLPLREYQLLQGGTGGGDGCRLPLCPCWHRQPHR